MPSSPAKTANTKLVEPNTERKVSCKLLCEVVLLDNTTFTATFEKKSTKGGELFDRVCSFLGVTKKEIFGLQYTSWEDGALNWLDMSKEIRSQRSKPYHFQFAVKFYPRNPRELDPVSRELMCLQVKDSLVRGKFLKPVSIKRHAILDGYFAQIIIGDFNPKSHKRGYIENKLGRFFVPPNGINSDEGIGELDYEAMVFKCHRSHLGLSRTEAITQFLELATEFPFYGVNLQPPSKDRDGNSVCIGIYENGVLVFDNIGLSEPGNLLYEFPWNEIVTLHQHNRHFHVLYYSEEKKDGSNYSFRFHGHYGHKTAQRTLILAMEHKKFFYHPDKKVHRRSRSFAEADSIARPPGKFDRGDKKYATTTNLKHRYRSSFGKIKSNLRSKMRHHSKSQDLDEAGVVEEAVRPISMQSQESSKSPKRLISSTSASHSRSTLPSPTACSPGIHRPPCPGYDHVDSPKQTITYV